MYFLTIGVEARSNVKTNVICKVVFSDSWLFHLLIHGKYTINAYTTENKEYVTLAEGLLIASINVFIFIEVHMFKRHPWDHTITF